MDRSGGSTCEILACGDRGSCADGTAGFVVTKNISGREVAGEDPERRWHTHTHTHTIAIRPVHIPDNNYAF